ncbi:MAG: hypothetical protein IPL93_01160, partial [Actinomycetales bacterium]|nr:hypothetical protein [Actinomycetales bacterium]
MSIPRDLHWSAHHEPDRHPRATPSFTVEPSGTRSATSSGPRSLANPGFGKSFTDHMVLATWTRGQGWHDAKVTAYG